MVDRTRLEQLWDERPVLSLEKIAQEFGVTRERIRQLAVKYELPARPRASQTPTGPRVTRIHKKCLGCDVVMMLTQNEASRRKFCSRGCQYQFNDNPDVPPEARRRANASPEEQKAQRAAWMRWYYHNVIKKDPVKLARVQGYNRTEHAKEYHRTWAAKKLAADPDYFKKRSRVAYAKKKNA